MLKSKRKILVKSGNNHLLQEKRIEGPAKKQRPDHQTEQIIFLESIKQSLIQKLSIFHPINNGLSEQENAGKYYSQIIEAIKFWFI